MTAVHAVGRSGLQAGETAAVLGAGGIGQILIQLLRSREIRVVAIDRSDANLVLARECGAQLTLKSDQPDAARILREYTGTNGAQCVFDCVGSAQTLRASADYVIRCGRIVVIGEEREDTPIHTTEIAQRELEIIGSRNGTRKDTVEAIKLLEAGVVHPPIAQRFPLEEINEAYDAVRHGASGRVVVVVRE